MILFFQGYMSFGPAYVLNRYKIQSPIWKWQKLDYIPHILKNFKFL